jgi:hypothetical protein
MHLVTAQRGYPTSGEMRLTWGTLRKVVDQAAWDGSRSSSLMNLQHSFSESKRCAVL